MRLEARAGFIEDETVLLLDSGELPEVAYYSALWQLCGDPNGPRLTLTREEQQQLQDAALRRCQQIILRDLDPNNRDRRIWRGPLRSICNWRRYLNFCQRIERSEDAAFRERVAIALTFFLTQELADLRSGRRQRSSVNCTSVELLAFAYQLGCNENIFSNDYICLCCHVDIDCTFRAGQDHQQISASPSYFSSLS